MKAKNKREHEFYLTEKTKNMFTFEQAEKFVKENAKPIGERVSRNNARGWKCVDGRTTDAERFAGPGGALGIMFAVFAGVEKWQREKAPAGLNFDPEEISRVVGSFLGEMSCHTDSYAVHDGQTLACAGCGHCNGALEKPADYGLINHASYLRGYVEKSGIQPEVLLGAHGEGAVIVINKAGEKIRPVSLPGTGADGRQTFICHLSDYLETIVEVSEKVAQSIAEKNPGLDTTALSTCTKEAAVEQVEATLRSLAEGLPRFQVFYDENGKIMVKAI